MKHLSVSAGPDHLIVGLLETQLHRRTALLAKLDVNYEGVLSHIVAGELCAFDGGWLAHVGKIYRDVAGKVRRAAERKLVDFAAGVIFLALNAPQRIIP